MRDSNDGFINLAESCDTWKQTISVFQYGVYVAGWWKLCLEKYSLTEIAMGGVSFALAFAVNCPKVLWGLYE
jgi:hypothetical protein